MVTGKGDLTVVPEVGAGVDLAAYKEFKEPIRIRCLTVQIEDGILEADKRLGPPAIAGNLFLWMVDPDAVETDPPLILPRIVTPF